MNKQYPRDLSDDELVEASHPGKAGRTATHYIVEMNRRLKTAIVELKDTTERQQKVLIRLTWSIGIFTAVILLLTIVQVIMLFSR